MDQKVMFLVLFQMKLFNNHKKRITLAWQMSVMKIYGGGKN